LKIQGAFSAASSQDLNTLAAAFIPIISALFKSLRTFRISAEIHSLFSLVKIPV